MPLIEELNSIVQSDAYLETKQTCEKAAAEIVRLRAALTDAHEGLEEMFGYVPVYFQEKWEHSGYIERAKDVLDNPA